ncbi:hypothetical protein ACGGZK_17245 [Agromyces sp. MMS24-K17]|uniref:hypothetical protein n=1 Tax=Agromyces sp. MMS24-K17 TaxID=3372850 RepID=UPI0037546C73
MHDKRHQAIAILMGGFLALAAIIAHAEIDRLIAGSLSSGRSQTLTALIGPLAFTEKDDAYAIWSTSNSSTLIGWFILCAVAVDAVLIAVYASALLFGIIRANRTDPRPSRVIWFIVLIAAEAFEGALLVLMALSLITGERSLIGATEATATLLAIVSTTKVVALVIVVVGLLRRFGRRLWKTARRLAKGLWLHRLSTVLVLILFALSCVPLDSVFDQLPDIQRQWVVLDHVTARHLVAGVVVTAIAYEAALLFGRTRTRVIADRLQELRRKSTHDTAETVPWYPRIGSRTIPRSRGNEPDAKLYLAPIDWWWSAPVVIFTLMWLVTGATTGEWGVQLPTWLVFVLLPLAVVLFSTRPATLTPQAAGKSADGDHPKDVIEDVKYGWFTGDVVAALIPSVVGLGLVRSLTGPVVVQFVTQRSAGYSPTTDASFRAWVELSGWAVAPVLLLTGIGIAVLAPLLLWRPTARRASRAWRSVFDPTRRYGIASRMRRHLWRLGAAFAAGIAVLAWVMVMPLQAAGWFGPPALAVLVLTAWGAVLGAFTVSLQEFPPAPVFIRLRLRATPVLTMAMVIPLIAGIWFAAIGRDDAFLHAPRTIERDVLTSDSSPFLTADAYLATRIAQIANRGCTVEAAGREFRPLFVVAAEGGGIRAAYWTASAFELLRREGGCLADSVLLSSGVSGGSVGLAIVAANEQARNFAREQGETASAPGPLADMLRHFASAEAVGAAMAGLLVRDQLSEISGLRLPSLLDGEPRWRDGGLNGWDRAALIEHAWVNDVPALGLSPDWAGSSDIGIPVFNSTDARTKCKVVITPLPVQKPRVSTAPSSAWDCTGPRGAPVTLPVPKQCFEDLDWASVAMLSARFPLITPAARFSSDQCGAEDLQLIDGGYAEPTGLGTVADFAPLIVSKVGAANAARADEPPLVPVLLYLKNSAGYDLRSDIAQVAAEPLVPFVGFAASGLQQDESALTQRISAIFRTTRGGALGRHSMDLIEDGVPGLAVTIAPSTTPAVVPPLGWALSPSSMQGLDAALAANFATADGQTPSPVLQLLQSRARWGVGDGLSAGAQARFGVG